LFTFQSFPEKEDNQKERMERGVRVLALTFLGGNSFVTIFLFVILILLFGCRFLLNG